MGFRGKYDEREEKKGENDKEKERKGKDNEKMGSKRLKKKNAKQCRIMAKRA